MLCNEERERERERERVCCESRSDIEDIHKDIHKDITTLVILRMCVIKDNNTWYQSLQGYYLYLGSSNNSSEVFKCVCVCGCVGVWVCGCVCMTGPILIITTGNSLQTVFKV